MDGINWDWYATPVLSQGPARVVTDKPDPTFKARPVGFVTGVQLLKSDSFEKKLNSAVEAAERATTAQRDGRAVATLDPWDGDGDQN